MSRVSGVRLSLINKNMELILQKAPLDITKHWKTPAATDYTTCHLSVGLETRSHRCKV